MRVEVDAVRFSYNGQPILNGVSFSVAPGEILTIVGQNGSGKTTLLKNISGVLPPNGGAVYLGMKQPGEMLGGELARCLAAVEQEREVGFDFTVRQLVSMGRFSHRGRFARESDADRQKIAAAMKSTNVTQFAERPIHTLSGGERQRVFLAMGLAQDPKVLLLDEPTTHLDINYQIQIMEIVRRQATAGLTVLMALHDLNSAAQYSDRVAILHDGVILAIGEPAYVLTEINIKTAFDAEVRVGRDPFTGSIYVTPHPQKV